MSGTLTFKHLNVQIRLPNPAWSQRQDVPQKAQQEEGGDLGPNFLELISSVCTLGNVNQGALSIPGLTGRHVAQGQSEPLQGLCSSQVKQGCKEDFELI